MENQSACPRTTSTADLRIESVPFSRIPGQSRLFIEYQDNSTSLERFYPSAVSTHADLADHVPEVLANCSVDRNALCGVLERTNREFGAGDKTFEYINDLRDAGSVAVVTGQQAGLFTGPLYSIYKALSAVRSAECLRRQGVKAVPVFWIAGEDHDLAEVSSTFVIGRDGDLTKITNTPRDLIADLPVGRVYLDDTIAGTIDRVFESLTPTEFSAELRSLFESSWAEGTSFGDAFGRLLTGLTREYGLILFSPLEHEFKELAAPIYAESIERSEEINLALIARSNELTADGYHAQVMIDESSFPLFWHNDDGQRIALKRKIDGSISTKDGAEKFSITELVSIARSEPWRFSPGVTMRSVVQDHLLPTVCYFGGSAEIAYFAQNSEVYRVLERPVTPILHRQSFTIVEPRHARTLERFQLTFDGLFRRREELLAKIVDKHIGRDGAGLFGSAEENINIELDRLDQELSRLDQTLAENLATRRRKIIYHIGALRNKFRRAQITKDDAINRQINAMFNALLPNGGLQERSINVAYFINRYGPTLIDWIYESADLDDKAHRLVYL